MAAPILEHGPVVARAAERAALEAVEDLLNGDERCLRLAGASGDSVELPEPVSRILRQAVHALVRGDTVTVANSEVELTSNQAADLLNVSRPYLIKLLDRGDIPFLMVGTHRRVRLGDLLEYRAARDARREAALSEMIQMSQELGLYDR